MTTIRVERDIAASTEQVWDLLADYKNIDFFNPHISESRLLDDSANEEVGATRQCDFSDGKNWIRERVVDWQPGRSYTIDIYEGTMPLKRALTTIGVKPDGDRSRAYMEIEYTPKFGLLGSVMDALMLNRFMKNSMTGILQGLEEKVTLSPSAQQEGRLAA